MKAKIEESKIRARISCRNLSKGYFIKTGKSVRKSTIHNILFFTKRRRYFISLLLYLNFFKLFIVRISTHIFRLIQNRNNIETIYFGEPKKKFNTLCCKRSSYTL